MSVNKENITNINVPLEVYSSQSNKNIQGVFGGSKCNNEIKSQYIVFSERERQQKMRV